MLELFWSWVDQKLDKFTLSTMFDSLTDIFIGLSLCVVGGVVGTIIVLAIWYLLFN